MKTRSVLFFIFVLFVPIVTTAEEENIDIIDFLDMLVSNEWDGNFDSLNYEDKDPAVSCVAGPHMLAWIDIVGFRNMSRINNIDYINGDPVNCVIVESDVKDLLTWNDNVDWIHKNLSCFISGENITATLNITMLWHHSTKTILPNGKPKIKKDYSYAFMTITDTEKVPFEYVYTAASIPAFVTYYNNTFSPKSIINIPGKAGLFYIEYSYDNESIRQNLMNAGIETNSKGIEFVNFSDAKKWEDPEGNLSHLAGSCVIKGANFTLDDLNISLRTPYRSFDVTDYNFTINNVSAGTCVNPSIITFIAVISLLLFTLVTIIKQTRR